VLLHAGGEDLHTEVITVAIHDQAGKEIRFGENKPIGSGIGNKSLTELPGSPEAPSEEIFIQGLLPVGKEADQNLRGGTGQTTPQEPPPEVIHVHPIAAGQIVLHPMDLPRKHPQMALQEALLPSSFQEDFGFFHISFTENSR